MTYIQDLSISVVRYQLVIVVENELQNEFSSIRHKLRDLGELTNKELHVLLEKYIM